MVVVVFFGAGVEDFSGVVVLGVVVFFFSGVVGVVFFTGWTAGLWAPGLPQPSRLTEHSKTAAAQNVNRRFMDRSSCKVWLQSLLEHGQRSVKGHKILEVPEGVKGSSMLAPLGTKTPIQ